MNAVRRARLTFGVLVVVAIAALGIVTRALAWPASPATGLTVAAGSAVGVVAGALALRILVVLDRGR